MPKLIRNISHKIYQTETSRDNKESMYAKCGPKDTQALMVVWFPDNTNETYKPTREITYLNRIILFCWDCHYLKRQPHIKSL